MRNLSLLFASVGAVTGAAALIIALVGMHGQLRLYVVAIAALTTLGATTRAIRTARQSNP